MANRHTTDCERFHRRDFLKIGAGAGLLGLSLPQLLRLEAMADRESVARRKADSVIMVWLAGGPSHLDMWDLKPEAPDGIRGEFKPIPTSVKGVQISEHLPKMAKTVDKVTIVRSLEHTVPAHGPATIFMTTGNKPTPALHYPSLGSLIARLLPQGREVPPYVVFDARTSVGNAGYLGTTYNPFRVEGIPDGKGKGGTRVVGNLQVRGITLPTGFTLEELENRVKLLEGFDHGLKALEQSPLGDGLDSFHRKALEMLRSEKTRKAFDLSAEPEATRERYGMGGFGQGTLAARRLVEAGVRFVTVSLSGWDTHGKNFEALSKTLLPQLDQTLSALIEDLDKRGMLERTVVYCAGEFGRTPKINPNAGRDHWARSMAVVLAGGGFRRGYVHGSTDAQGMASASDGCTPDDVSATLFHCLGLDPHQELMSPTGRPIQLFREGKVIEKLLG
jgi:hypothetical protein